MSQLTIHSPEQAMQHFVNSKNLQAPFPQDTRCAIFGLGCFWGAERLFWTLPEVYTTAVGYAGGQTRNPSYQEVCGGATGHIEVVLVVYHEGEDSYLRLLKTFWESNDPTQGMRSGNDIGTQYQSAILCGDDSQYQAALASRDAYQQAISQRGFGAITTRVDRGGDFYYAEEYHQQYLAKNPNGYCGIKGLGVDCPAGLS